jgi:hypothetical protein
MGTELGNSNMQHKYKGRGWVNPWGKGNESAKAQRQKPARWGKLRGPVHGEQGAEWQKMRSESEWEERSCKVIMVRV